MGNAVTELDKSDVLAGLFASWDALDGLLSGLSEQQWQKATPLPGWSVHAVVAHIVGTESALLGMPTPDPDIDVSALAHVRNDFGASNECWVRHLSGVSGAELHQQFLAVTGDRRKRLADMSDDDWNALTPPRPARAATGGSCGCGSSIAGCTSTTSAMRWAGRPPTPSWRVRRRGWRWTRWPPAWATSSANSAGRPTGHGLRSS